jgi:2-methylcitrate dehydratase PrpD
MTIAHQIAQRIHALRPDQITETTREWTRHAFIDTIGCALAGMAEEAPHIILRVPGVATAPGPALIWASDRRTSALDATLVNGTAAHALDYDDVAGVMGGHPSAMLVPPLLALADEHDATGQDLAMAYTVGFETACRIARGVHFHHYDKGWHPTATLGIFGATAAACRLLRLDVDTTATALALAASFASGLKANFGTMTKPLHVGHATRNGLFAALMARAGYTANPAAFEHKQGFLDVFNGPGTYDTARILADWYEPLETDGSADPNLKPYPCCGSTHASVGRMLDLTLTHDLRPADIARIEVMPHARRLPHTDNPDPRTPLAAKFSIQYCVARAVADRSVRLDHFEGEAHFDPAIRALMRLVEARPHPDMPNDSPLQWGAEVIVHLRDGRRLASREDDYQSRGPAGIPMTHDELWTKFSDCAERALPRARVAPLFQSLATIETLASSRDLSRLMVVTRPETRAAE